MGYKCKSCNSVVLIIEGQEPIRSCKCPKHTPIIAEMSGKAKGVSNIKQ